MNFETLVIEGEALPRSGEMVKVRRGARHQRLAVVDEVSEDGTLIWLAAHGAHTRTLFHRENALNVWVGSWQP